MDDKITGGGFNPLLPWIVVSVKDDRYVTICQDCGMVAVARGHLTPILPIDGILLRMQDHFNLGVTQLSINEVDGFYSHGEDHSDATH